MAADAMFDTLFRLALSPVLITQALRVRRTAQLLPEATGPRSGRAGQGKPLSLRIIGDSSAAGVGALHQSQALAGQLETALTPEFDVTWHLIAQTGATTRSTLETLRGERPDPTDVIVVALGVNDVTRLLPRKIWMAQQDRLITRLRALYQPRMIYRSGVPPLGEFPLLPNPLRWTLGRHASGYEAALARAYAHTSDVTHVPFNMALDPKYMASDGFHPNPDLYQLWAEEMASRIRADWPKFSSRS